MKNFLIRIVVILLVSLMICPMRALAVEMENEEQESDAGYSIGIQAPHAVLMEASTGMVLYEKDAHTARPPASVTKIMTMLLIFEALEDGKIKLDDTVVVSEKAASMGGSQVFLEPNEKQTVDTMLKCIAVASANDACVAYRNGRQKESLCIVRFFKIKFEQNISLDAYC